MWQEIQQARILKGSSHKLYYICPQKNEEESRVIKPHGGQLRPSRVFFTDPIAKHLEGVQRHHGRGGNLLDKNRSAELHEEKETKGAAVQNGRDPTEGFLPHNSAERPKKGLATRIAQDQACPVKLVTTSGTPQTKKKGKEKNQRKNNTFRCF